MEYRLREFDPASTKHSRIWLIIGPRGSGKTILLRDILYKTRKHYDIGLAMTATTSTVDTFKDFIPYHLIFKKGYNYEQCEQLLKVSKDLTAQGKQQKALLILDDCMFDSKVMKSDAQTEIHLNGRHSGISLINTTQYAMIIPPAIRTNIDYVLVLQDSVLANRKRLHSFFFGNFPTFKDFDRVFNNVTENNGALVLDRTKNTSNIEDCTFYYKASMDLPQFRIGKKIYWSMDRAVQKYREQHKDSTPVLKV